MLVSQQLTIGQSGKKYLGNVWDIEAPSVVTVLLYQLKYGDAASSGVTLGGIKVQLRDATRPLPASYSEN